MPVSYTHLRSGDVVDGTEREPEQVKAGYHYGSGILPFAIFNSVWYTRLSPVKDVYKRQIIDCAKAPYK